MRSGHPYRFSSKSYLLLILGFLFFLDGFALWLAITVDHSRTLQQARVILETTAISLQERMERVVFATEAILKNRALRVREKGMERTVASRREWEHFRGGAQSLPGPGELWLLDHRGYLAMDSVEYPSRPADFSGREYFAAHRDRGEDLHIGPVLKGKIVKKYAFTISKRIRGHDGGFLGVVLASIETDAFAEFLSRISLGEGGTVAVFRGDGALILRQPMEDGYVGKNFSHLTLFDRDFEESPWGSFETDKPIDGVGRIIGYSKIMGLPLIVATTIPLDSVLAGWRGRVRIYSIVAIVAFMALVALSLVIRRTTSREEQERTRQLAEINASLQAQIAGRIRAQAALKESEERWATTLASIGDGIIATDVAGRVTFVNAVAEKLTGWKSADAVGRNAADVFTVIDENTRQAIRDSVARVLETGTTAGLSNSTVLIRKDGREIPLDDSGSPILDSEGNMTGVVLVFRDITDRRAAQKEITDSRRDLSKAQAVAHVGSWRLHASERELVWSDETYRIFGIAPGTPISYEMFLGMVHPDDRETLIEGWKGALGGTCYDITHRIVVGGHIKWVREVAELDFDQKGILLAGFGTVQDVTDQKRMEQALQLAHDGLELRVQERTAEIRRQAELLDLAHDAIIVTNTQGRTIFWNTGAVATYGFTRKDVAGRDHHAILGTRYPIPVENILATVESSGRWEGELTQTTKDGRQIVVLSRWAMRRGEAGGPPEILEINTDITTRRRTEEALRLASVYNRNLIEASLDPLVTIDLEGRISDVNSATELITGCSRTELIGTDHADCFTQPEKARAGYRLVFERGFVRDYPLEIRHRSGRSTSVLYNSSLYSDESGRIIGVVATARDITEKSRLEKHLQEKHKMEAIGTLAGGIAHDFNNIIAGIIGFAEMVLDDLPEDSPAHRRLGYVLKGAHRGRDLVKQILAFSRRYEQEKKIVSLDQVIDEVVALMRATLPATIEIRRSNTARSDLVSADPTQIHQVVVNLCSNAAQAMNEKGGIIEISLAEEVVSSVEESPHQDLPPGSYVRLTVSDNGRGMEPATLERVFEPFFTTKPPGEGTGLGLAVVHGIVRNHDGVITTSSRPGKGTSFSIYIPRIQAGPAEEIQRVEVALGGPESVLVVDDEEFIVEMSKQRLQRFGYRAMGATSSAGALELFRADPGAFDLVVIDHIMPEMTGLELARELLGIKPDIRIIMCSGLNEPVPMETMRQAGIRDFFTKPADRNEFIRIVRNVLDSPL